MMNLAFKPNPLTQALATRPPEVLTQQEMEKLLEKGKEINQARAYIDRLNALGRRAVKKNSYPHINPKYDGMEYGGWMEISMANRPAEWRLKRMKFYGDWCSTEQLEEILPDIKCETRSRAYAITPVMVDRSGAVYEITTYICINPENMDDLELQVREYLRHVATLNGYEFDLDNCYFEVRA